MSTDLTFLLVHGSWHDGSCWSAVAERLADAGFASISPTLPGHHAAGERSRVTHDDYVDTVVAALDAAPGEVVLVGHSFGGSVISRAAEQRPGRCRLLVYCSAFVPRDGERVADSLPEPFLTFLDQASAATADGSVVLPREIFGSAFANTAEPATVNAIYPRLVPEPYGPIFERLPLPRFARLEIPAAYIVGRLDQAMPPGTFHPGQSGRLSTPQLIEIDGDHESMFTKPRELTWALLEAAGVTDATAVAQRLPASPAPHAQSPAPAPLGPGARRRLVADSAELADSLGVQPGADVLMKELCAQLGPATNLQLGVDRLHVVLHGVARDPELACDLIVGRTPGQQLGHLALARRQAVQRQPYRFKLGHSGRRERDRSRLWFLAVVLAEPGAVHR